MSQAPTEKAGFTSVLICDIAIQIMEQEQEKAGELIPSRNKVGEVLLSALWLNVLSVVMFIALGGMALFLGIMTRRFFIVEHIGIFFLLTILISFAYIPLKLLLHGVGAMLFGGLPWSRLKFGIMWRALGVYYYLKDPVPLPAYKKVILLPTLVLFPLSLGLLLLLPCFCTVLTVALAGGGIGDIMVCWKLRKYDNTLLAVDHPTRIGTEVFEPADRKEEGDRL